MSRRPRRAFTLVELLVVIGIVALLLGMLLPALARAREASASVACLANLRTLGQALTLYTSQYNGYIPGSGNTTGRHFWKPGVLTNSVTLRVFTPAADTLPSTGPISPTDYVAPLAEMMKLPIPESNSAVPRYQAYREMRPFLCPANNGTIIDAYTGGGGPDAGVGQMLGYATATTFLFTTAASTIPNQYPGVTDYTRLSGGTTWWTIPTHYFPKVNRIGKASEKVYLADAAKYVSPTNAGTYNLDPYVAASGDAIASIYTDYGPFTKLTRAYDRSVADGGNGFDGRVLSYRHGARKPGLPTGAYRMNALFFDGHAETLDEVTSLSPALWLPSKSVIPNATKIQPATDAHWIKGMYPYTVP